MTPERYRQIEDLYHAAAEIAPDLRSGFLREACGADEKLFEELQALLAADAGISEHSFLKTPAIELVAAEIAASWTGSESASLSGRVFGYYEVKSVLGKGGMGEVYLGLDTKLKREVAIKILPAPFATDRERRARFEREAQALASLNHSGIAAIYGLEEIDGVRFLVLELVEGQTIADLLLKGRIEPVQALRIAAQIAEAVEAAHEKNIVHRDLKPANVKLTPDGKVKVLDFGLAKALADPASSADSESPPTVRTGETRTGMVVGTAAYMSPEQASGKTVDRRTDVWSFGVMLYEMLSGKRPFEGKTASHIIVEVLEREPDWSALPALPDGVRDLLERCLEKEPANRLRSIGDIGVLLQSVLKQKTRSRVAATTARNSRSFRLAGLLGVAAALLVAVALFSLNRQKAPAPLQLSIPFLESPLRMPFSVKHLAISEDGSRVAYAAASGLWVRQMDQKEPTLLGRSVGTLFFSPDGMWVAYFRDDGLYKIAVDGGTPVQLVSSSVRYFGGSWHAKAGIVFATTEGLYQVAPEGERQSCSSSRVTNAKNAGTPGRNFCPTDRLSPLRFCRKAPLTAPRLRSST